jgi:glucuronoarabinoxylan endo-1,4-beta-xylanase
MNNGSSNQSITYNLKGISASSVIPYTTSATQNIEEGSEIALSGSNLPPI